MVGVARGARKENLVENNDCDKFADRVHDVKNDCRAYSRSILKKMSHSIWYLCQSEMYYCVSDFKR